jgi:uncharacterized protein YvpB
MLTTLAACQPAGPSNSPNLLKSTSTLSPAQVSLTLTPFHPTSDTPQQPTETETQAPPTATPTPLTPIICDANAPEPPAQALVTGVVGYEQAYSLSCEARSAADLAAYWDVAIVEGVFFSQLPKSDNPEVGFVGFVDGYWGKLPPNSYGVHAEPVANVMRQYGLEALAHKGLSFRCLQLEIAAGRPVLVWIVGHAWQGQGESYISLDGTETTVAPYEHTMILIGYDEYNVYLVDAWTAVTETHSIATFLYSWAQLDNMALTVTGADPEMASSMQYAGGYYRVQYGDSLRGLADVWGIPWDSLAGLNGIVWPFDIYPGQILKTGQPLTADSYPTPSPTPSS